MKEGKFRKDLYERLNVVPIRTPELKMHKSDIPEVAAAWFARKKYEKTLTGDQVAALMRYDYPGNVRELLNLLERAEMLGEMDYERLLREHREMNGVLAVDVMPAAVKAEGVGLPKGQLLPLEEVIRRYVASAFEQCGSSVVETARALGVSRNTVRKYKVGAAGKEG